MTVDEIYSLITQNITNSIQNENWNTAILYMEILIWNLSGIRSYRMSFRDFLKNKYF